MADGQIRYKVGFDIQKKGLDQLKASLQDLQKMKISDIMKINDTDAKTAQRALIRIKEQATNVQAALKSSFNTKLNTVNIQTFNGSLKSSKTSIEQVYSAFKAAGTVGENAFRNLSNQVLSTNIQLRQSHGILDKMATTLANTIKWNAASGAVNGLTRSVQQAWGYVKALDGSLNDIRIVTGKSADDMANFAVQANNAAKELGRTTTDYTNAALIFAQQGLSDAEVEQRAKITLKAANVTGQSTDAVSEQLTAVWNGYKVTAEEAQLYVDRLAAVAATTASDLEELSTGMSKVASAAAAMGVGEDQLAAQLSTIISVTRQAPETVGTALRTVYARISDIEAGIEEDGVTLGKYSGEMEALGFNVLDASGHLRDMGEVMQEIGSHWADLTREQQISLAQTMAGQRQYSNLIALFDNFEKYNEALYTAQNAAGTLQEQQDIAMESMGAHLNVLKASMEDVFDSLIDPKALDGIKSLVDGLASVATFVAKFVDSLGGGMSVLSLLGATAVIVFSEQIGKGLNTTITNFEIGKENARQFSEALEATRNWQGIPGLDELSKELLSNRQRLLELARLMSPEQFSGMQALLKDITEVGNELTIVIDKQQKLKTAIEGVLSSGDKWKTQSDVMGDEAGQQAVIDRITKQQEALKTARQALKQYVKDLQELNQKAFKGEDISEGIKKSKEQLIKYAAQLREMADQGALEQHSESIKKLQEELGNLDDDLPAEQIASKLIVIGSRLKNIATDASTSATEIRQELEKNFANAADSIEQRAEALKQTLEAKKAQFKIGMDKSQRAATISDYAKLAGGIAQVGTAIQQVQNLGSIWNKKDLDLGQRLLQTITNLATSLPLMAMGIYKVSTALGVMKLAEEGAIATDMAHAGAISLVKTASGEAAIAIKTMNGVLLASPMVGFAAAAIGVVSVLGLIKNGFDQARKAEIEHDKEILNQQKSIQDEISSHKELYNTLDQLKEKYSQQQITRAELKTEIQNLIERYGLEGKAAQALRGHYNDLTTATLQLLKAQAQRTQISAAQGVDAASDKLEKRLNKSHTMQAGSAKNASDFELLKNLGLEDDTSFTIKWDGIEDFASEYNRIQEIVDDAYKLVDKGVYSREELRDFPLFNQLRDFLGEYKEDVKDFQEQTELASLAAADFALAENQLNGNIDLQGIDGIIEYLEQRNKIAQIMSENGVEDVIGSTNDYLKNFAADAQSQFGPIAEFLDQIPENVNMTKEAIQTMQRSLSDFQINKLLEIDPENYNTAEKLAKVLNDIAKLNFSNLGGLSPDQIGAMYDSAVSNYATLQEAQDKVDSGKNLSSSEYKSLTEANPELDQFFEKALNGTYRLKTSAEEFNRAIQNLKFKPLLDSLVAVENELQNLNSKAGNFKVADDNLKTSASQITKSGDSSFDTELATKSAQQEHVSQQLDFLSQSASEDDAYLQRLIAHWKELNDQGKVTQGVQHDIAEKVKEISNNSEQALERQKALTEQAEKIHKALRDALDPLDKDIDTGQFEQMVKLLKDGTVQIQDWPDNLQMTDEIMEDMAEAILRFEDAGQDVTKNFDKWKKALSGGGGGIAAIMQDLRDTYADLFDVEDGSILPTSFLADKENLELMKAAIEGNEDAYNSLADIMSQEIYSNLDAVLADLGATQDQIYSAKSAFNSLMDDMQNPDWGNAAWVEGLKADCQAAIDALLATGMSAEEAVATVQGVVPGMSFDTQINNATSEVTDTQDIPYWTYSKDAQDFTYKLPKIGSNPTGAEIGPKTAAAVVGVDVRHGTAEGVRVNTGSEQVEGMKQVTSPSVTVTNVGPSATGKTKINNTTRKGGGGKGGGGKKKGGGGGRGRGKKKPSSSKSKADTSTKDTKKPLKDDLDIYHDINVQINKIGKNLNRAQKQQERLFGKDLLKNLKDQRDLLEEHNQKLKKKHELQVTDLANQRKALQSLGVTFDKLGNINNYMTVLQGKQKTVNDLINQYNKKIEQYNKSTNKTNKEKIAKEAEKISKKIEDAEDVYKDLEDKIGNYDDLRDEMQDLLDQIQENTQQQIELTIQGFRTELEIRLDLGQAERNWNEFRRNVLQKTNVLKDMEFDGIFKDALKSIDDIYTYIGKEGSIGTITTLMQQLEDTQAEIEQMNKEGGVSLIYGTNKAQAMEDLESDLDQLMSQLEDIEDLVNEIDEAYLDTIDDIADQFDAQIQGYEYVGELLEHDMDLLSLLYGDKNYDAMNRYYTALAENNNKQLDFLREQANYWQQNWVKAMEEGNVQAAKEFEEHYKDTIDNLNSLISDSVENLQDKYINAIEQIFDTLDRKITNGKGMDYLGMEWDLLNKNAEDYLDTINAAFAVQDLERKYNKALGETTSIKNQRALKKVMDEQLNNLKAKDKLTQYDVDRAEKLLEIEKARIALEDVRAQKTSLRLKRDSQGNYSYEYVADMDEVAEAQEALAAAQNDLYNFDKEQYQSNVDEVLAAWQDFQSEYKDIITDLSLTEEDRVNKLKLLREQYGKYINNKTAENAVIRVNLMDSAFADLAAIYEQDVQNYMQMADEEKDIIMNQLVPAWNSGIQEMANLIINEGGFIPVCQQAFDSIAEVTEEYVKELQTLGLIAGVNFEDLKEGADYVADGMASLIKQNNELISSMKSEMEAIDLLRKQAQKLSKDYNDVTKAAAAAVTKIQDFVKAQKTAAAQTAKENKPKTTASKNSSSSTTNKTTPTKNSSNNNTNNKNSTSNTSSNTSNSGTSSPAKTGVQRAAEIAAQKAKQEEEARKKQLAAIGGLISSTGINKKWKAVTMSSGGYTGNWNSDDGKLAFLHKKELVLNEQDTKNVLNSVSILRTLMGSLNTTVANKIFDLNHGNKASMLQSIGNNENVNQAVQISATFPNVNSRREIEEAFNNLVNMAAQRALE